MAKEQEPIAVHKVTLTSKKVVLLRDIELRDEENAAKLSGKKAGDSAITMGYGMLNELVKILIISIDGKEVGALERERLDKILGYRDFVQLRKTVEKMMGEAAAEPTVEFVSSGQS